MEETMRRKTQTSLNSKYKNKEKHHKQKKKLQEVTGHS
jgi:hypothetical protein